MRRVLLTLLLPLFLGFSSSSHSVPVSAPIDDQLAIAYKKNAGVGVIAGVAAGLASARWLFSPGKKDSMWERLSGYRWYQTKKRNSSHAYAWQIAENVTKGMVVVAIATGTAWGVYHTLNAPVEALNQLKEENKIILETVKNLKEENRLVKVIEEYLNIKTLVTLELEPLNLRIEKLEKEVNILKNAQEYTMRQFSSFEKKIKDLYTIIGKNQLHVSSNSSHKPLSIMGKN